MLAWSMVAHDFAETEGCLRDLYVRSTTIDDWTAVLGAIARSGLRHTYSRNGIAAPIPDSAEPVFRDRSEHAPYLCVHLGPIEVSAHFFDEAGMEFSLDPREVRGPRELAMVERFMFLLAQATDKPCVLVHEHAPDDPILEMSPAGESRYAGRR